LKRVVITGLGPVTPIGIGKEDYWNSLIAGKSGVDYITRFDTENFPTKIAAEIKNFTPENYIDKKVLRRMDRFTQYALVATHLALKDGEVTLEKEDKERIGVVLGSGIGGMETLELEHSKLLENGPRRVSPVFIPMMISNMASGQISIYYGLKGPSMVITTACASGSNAIGEAFRMIQTGGCDLIITGGSEAAITPVALAGFSSMKALSTRNHEPSKASRPFDKDRDGFVMGEGAGVIILEELEHALKRGARIYAELVGYGASSDAYHMTAPDPSADGAKRAMELALKDGDVDYHQVDYINAHGTSTYYNDKLETLAIKSLFKEQAYKLHISSTKSMTGHLLGAAGGIEVIATALAVNEGKIPPTINYEIPDEECDLNYVPNEYVEREIRYAMSNSLGFGGHNATLLLKKWR